MPVTFRFEPGEPPVGVIVLEGTFDAIGLPAVNQAVSEMRASGTSRIVLDVAQVEFLDSTAIGYIVQLASEVRDEEGDLALAAPSPFIEKTVETLGLSQMLTAYPTVAEAAAALRT